MTESLDDTQPRAPFKEQPPLSDSLAEDEAAAGGPGCLVWTLVGLVGLGLALVIVFLAATAGWTAGQRIAQTNGTATQSAVIQQQLERIPTDVAAGNLFLLSRRLDYLLTLTPGVPGAPQIVQTATALFLARAPTVTPTPTATPPAIAATPGQGASEGAPGAYDLDGLLQQAQAYVDLAQWYDAIDTLDQIIGLDSAYQSAAVRSLMLQALRSQAMILYNENRLAEAILLTTRAEDFGLSQDDPLRYEKYAAGLYQDAINAIGADYVTAIRALRTVYDLGPGRYYDDVARKLFQQYTAYGDAWASQNEYCPAYTQYASALSILSSAAVAAKRDNANNLCLQATPTPGPGVTPQAGVTPQPIAPVGVVETPGG